MPRFYRLVPPRGGGIADWLHTNAGARRRGRSDLKADDEEHMLACLPGIIKHAHQ